MLFKRVSRLVGLIFAAACKCKTFCEQPSHDINRLIIASELLFSYPSSQLINKTSHGHILTHFNTVGPLKSLLSVVRGFCLIFKWVVGDVWNSLLSLRGCLLLCEVHMWRLDCMINISGTELYSVYQSDSHSDIMGHFEQFLHFLECMQSLPFQSLSRFSFSYW